MKYITYSIITYLCTYTYLIGVTNYHRKHKSNKWCNPSKLEQVDLCIWWVMCILILCCLLIPSCDYLHVSSIESVYFNVLNVLCVYVHSNCIHKESNNQLSKSKRKSKSLSNHNFRDFAKVCFFIGIFSEPGLRVRILLILFLLF